MSGTSLDGADAVLVEFCDGKLATQAHASAPFPETLREELLALNAPGGVDELHRAALAANALAREYAQLVQAVLEKAAIPASAVRAIGAHGQTVRHRPLEFDGVGYTLQLNAPALLAELSGIDVVADFRTRDLAAGGQGAPLVPAFHRAVFGLSGQPQAVLNLGGIANLSVLPPIEDDLGQVLGFDCGPANALLDHWCREHTGRAFDEGGAWASTGQVLPDLLARMLAEPYFERSPPKSTGRDLFNPTWLQGHLRALTAAPRAEDVQATLSGLTAASVARDVRTVAKGVAELVVCGGGALNDDLLRRIQQALPGVHVLTSEERGLAPTQVEAAAFAWLARATVRREPGNLPGVTGARGPRVLGAIYPA